MDAGSLVFVCHHRHQAPRLAGTPPEKGASGLGDEYYPDLGNGGYDAQHYDLKLRVEPDTNELVAHSKMTAIAKQNLSSLNLDFHGLDIGGIKVNGEAAEFSREENTSELTIIPKSPLNAGQNFTVDVDYAGKPQAMNSRAGDFLVGWKNNGQGILVDSQPDGAQTWFPNNDHPLDKATYSLAIDVPRAFTAASNGTLLQIEEQGDRHTFHWASKDPMSSYLATVHIGDYVCDTQTGPGGLPIRNYFPPHLLEKARYDFGRTPEMIELFSKHFGKYPFEAYGAVVVDDQKALSGALETQTLSMFEPDLVTGDRRYESVVAHELGHQWFGNLVSLNQWRDLWLHEGFASYSEWLWLEHTDGKEALEAKADKAYGKLAAEPGIVIGRPPKDELFHHQVYLKGGLALHELRRKVGEEDFFGGLKCYLGAHAGDGEKNPSIGDFQKSMEEASGKPLGEFFQNWLYSEKLPARDA